MESVPRVHPRSIHAWRYGESESLALCRSRLRQLDEDRHRETDKGALIDSDTTPLTGIDFKPHEDGKRVPPPELIRINTQETDLIVWLFKAIVPC